MKYWIGVVSKDHVLRGVEEGIMQLGNDKKSPLTRLKKSDWLIYYSPTSRIGDKVPLQAFTAVGQVADDQIYQYHLSNKYSAYRRKVTYLHAKDVAIRPLIRKLSFIKSKTSWGYSFRFGLVEIPKSDFMLIKNRMVKDI